MTVNDDLLTPAEVALMAGATPAAVRQWADRGRLPVLRTPAGLRLFRRADVIAFLKIWRHGQRTERSRG
jgi:excisionase family DNA binding protein